MALELLEAIRDAIGDAIGDYLDAGTANTIEVRTGTPPATLATGDSGTLLATLTASATPFGAAASGAITAASITADSSADADGTPGHFRWKRDGTAVMQGTAGVGSGDLDFDQAIELGGTVSISSFVITVGNSDS